MLIFVTYDGIKNSVFDGQVLKPIEKKIKNNTYKQAIIISFEKEQISPEYIKNKLNNNPNIKIIILKTKVFLGKLALIPEIFKLKKILQNYKDYNLIARGPIAGWLSSKAICFTSCKSFTIQARGLLAQELKYTNKYAPQYYKKLINKIRYYQFNNLEKTIYKTAQKFPNTHIESVSQELKNYLITQFDAHPENIKIAKDDIPEIFEKNLILQWRKETRNILNIPTNNTVYCYNGSVKPWQCPQMVVSYFNNLLKNPVNKTQNIFLLILTQNIPQFQKILDSYAIPKNRYLIKTVNHQEIYQYLAASDYGVIFREKSIVNWVSRPTKILEYRSVDLKIIHNGTVGFLKNNKTN